MRRRISVHGAWQPRRRWGCRAASQNVLGSGAHPTRRSVLTRAERPVHSVATTAQGRQRRVALLRAVVRLALDPGWHQIASNGCFGDSVTAGGRLAMTAVPLKAVIAEANAAQFEGRFSKADFIYIARDDEYQCPAGERLRRHQSCVENGMRIDTYWTYICPHCPIKEQCTTGNERRVRRWEHEAVLDAMHRRLDRKPDAMKVRRRDRACLRNAETLDGFGARHEDTRARQYRNALARPCI